MLSTRAEEKRRATTPTIYRARAPDGLLSLPSPGPSPLGLMPQLTTRHSPRNVPPYAPCARSAAYGTHLRPSRPRRSTYSVFGTQLFVWPMQTRDQLTRDARQRGGRLAPAVRIHVFWAGRNLAVARLRVFPALPLTGLTKLTMGWLHVCGRDGNACGVRRERVPL